MPHQGPTDTNTPPQKLPDVALALSRIDQLSHQLGEMRHTLDNLRSILEDISKTYVPKTTS